MKYKVLSSWLLNPPFFGGGGIYIDNIGSNVKKYLPNYRNKIHNRSCWSVNWLLTVKQIYLFFNCLKHSNFLTVQSGLTLVLECDYLYQSIFLMTFWGIKKRKCNRKRKRYNGFINEVKIATRMGPITFESN